MQQYVRRQWVMQLGLVTALGFALSSHGGDILTVATTTSTDNSGLLAHIHPDFERRTGIRVKVIAKGTGASLQLAREGNADVVLVHAREQEDAFMREGYGINRCDVMYNDFVVIGPSTDPAGIRGLPTAAVAFERIAVAGQLFISRGDNSGTHAKEQYLWRQTEVALTEVSKEIIKDGKPSTFTMTRPSGGWHRSVGQGMGKTITYTTEKRGYCLTDRGTYYAYALGEAPRTDLVILCEGDPQLTNPYGVMAVNPKRFPDVNHEGASRYIDWLTSPATQAMIGAYRRDGEVLFHPAREPVE